MDNLNYNRFQRGVSMLEVLIAVFILAGGLLGLASVQMQSIKNVNNAQFHTLATTYAYDMAERMRSNRDGVTAGGYDAIDSAEADPGCATCSSTQMAQLDAYQWNQRIQANVVSGGLPTGKGTVTENNGLYDITVTWNEQQRNTTTGTVETASFTLSIQI